MLRNFSAILLSAALLFEPAFAQQSEGNITTPCNAHLGSLTDTAPHAYEKYFEWAKVPEAAAKFANERLPNTVETIAIAPVTPDEYNAIFGSGKDKAAQSLTEAQQKEIETVQETLKEKFHKDHGDRDFDEKGYKKVLQDEASSFVIVIGHNEHGMLRLLDGNLVFLDDIVAGARPNQRVILISRDSAKHTSNKELAATINREVTYDEAFEIAGRVSTFIKGAGGPVSLVEIQSQLTKDAESTQTKHKIAFFVMKAVCGIGTAIVVALIIRALDPCKDGDSPGCARDKKGGPDAGDKKHSTGWKQFPPIRHELAIVFRAA